MRVMVLAKMRVKVATIARPQSRDFNVMYLKVPYETLLQR